MKGICLCLLTVVCMSAEARKCTLLLRVKDESGARFAGARVAVLTSGEETVWSQETDADGRVSAEVASGSYVVLVDSPLHIPAKLPAECRDGNVINLNAILFLDGILDRVWVVEEANIDTVPAKVPDELEIREQPTELVLPLRKAKRRRGRAK